MAITTTPRMNRGCFWRVIFASGDTNNRFFLLRDAGEVTVKLYEILVEFFVIFFTTSAIIFNIEHAVNPEFGDLGDSLYWSFLTLTGNEQPFDVRSHPPRLSLPSPVLPSAVANGV